MKADWTPTGGTLATLGDDSVKWTLLLEQLGGGIEEQVTRLAFASAVSRLGRGNLEGACVFTAAKSHSSLDVAANFFKAEYARLNQSGLLVLTFTAATLSMSGAVLTGVQRVTSEEARGVRWMLRYTFGITTVT